MSEWIIGVDPSASKSSIKNFIGWAVMKDGELHDFGDLEPDAPYFTRIRMWLRNKFKIIFSQDSAPSIIVAVESAYLGKNPSVFLGLVQCQAHLCAVALDSGHTFRYITPLDSFRASTGLAQYPLNERGKRDGTRKPAIQAAIGRRYRFTPDQEISEHVYDAIAICEAVIMQQKRGR